MERALVVVKRTEAAEELAREAGELAAGVDAEVVVMHATTEDEYAARRRAAAEAPAGAAAYTADTAREAAASLAAEVAEDVLDDLDLDYETAGYVGDEGEMVLEAAAEHDCDHVFLTGRERSPTGKAVFGDATQRVVLDHDGPVTVVTA